MAKKFNGKKMSHGGTGGNPPKCPLCGITMRMFMGELRCAELRATKTAKGSGSRLMVKHGSLRTIRKRVRRGFPQKEAA